MPADPTGPLGGRCRRLPLPSRTLPPHDHTNSYLVAADGVGVVVDPGFHEERSLAATLEALVEAGVRFLKAVLLTHTHHDHVAGLPLLRERFPDVPVYAHPEEIGRLEPLAGLVALGDDRAVTVGPLLVRSLHTPGHSPGHLAYVLEGEGVALVGDLVAGEGSTWVGLPEGDVAAFLASLDRLLALGVARLGPGHGPAVADAPARLRAVRAHRLERERQLLDALAAGPRTLGGLRDAVYGPMEEEIADFAARSVAAHLVKLMREMKVVHLGRDEGGPYALRR